MLTPTDDEQQHSGIAEDVHPNTGELRSLDIVEDGCPLPPGFLDGMKEDICLRLQVEIQSGFSDLFVRLLEEIQNMSLLHGSANLHAANYKNIPIGLGNQQHSGLEAISEVHNSEGSNERSNNLGQIPGNEQNLGWEELRDVSSGIGLKESANALLENQVHKEQSRQSHSSNTYSIRSIGTSVKRFRQSAPLRDAVNLDIDKVKTSKIAALVSEVRSRRLKDVAFPDNCLVPFVLSKFFSGLSLILITANAIWIGYESDVQANQQFRGQSSGWQRSINIAFAICFIVELFLRIIALQKHFFFGDDWAWNATDVVLVLSSIPDMFGDSINVTFLRLMRVAKLSRAFRIIRLLKYCTSLREILLSLVCTLGSLGWSFVALLFVTYISALMSMQWINFKAQTGVSDASDVMKDFKTMQSTMVSLFSMISGGLEWYPVAKEFESQSDYLAVYALIIYIFVSLFGIVNVITGVFVAKATEASNDDKDLRIAKQEEQRNRQVKDLVKTFNDIDTEQMGRINQQKFNEYFQKYQGQYMLQSLGLQLFDLEKLWHVLDSHDGFADDSVDLVGFVIGVTRLAGNAKSTELVMLCRRVEEMHNFLRKNLPKFNESVDACGLSAKQQSPNNLLNKSCESEWGHFSL